MEDVPSVLSTYHIGPGSSSGQFPVEDDNGKVICYVDSISDAEETIQNLYDQETRTKQDVSGLKISDIDSFDMFQGYLFEKKHGYKGSFKDFQKEIKSSVDWVRSAGVPWYVNKSIQVENALKKMGWDTDVEFSNKSSSFYVTISTWINEGEENEEEFSRKIRFSDHELPGYYGGADYECRFDQGGTWEGLKKKLKKLWDDVQNGLVVSGFQNNFNSDLYSGGRRGIFSVLKRIDFIDEIRHRVEDGSVPRELMLTPLSDPSMSRYKYLLADNMPWPDNVSLFLMFRTLLNLGYVCSWVLDGEKIAGGFSYYEDVVNRCRFDVKFFSLYKEYQRC